MSIGRRDTRSRRVALWMAVTTALLSASGVAKTKKAPHGEVDRKPPVITHVRILRAPYGEAITIRARFDDESEIFAPGAYVRAEGTSEFENLPMQRVEDGYEATIPVERVTGNIEYFIEAFDAEGNGPARDGSPESPIRIAVEGRPPSGGASSPVSPDRSPLEPSTPRDPPPAPGARPSAHPSNAARAIVQPAPPPPSAGSDGSLLKKWWFWTIIGVAVTGGAAAMVVAFQGSGRFVGAVDIEVRGPDPAGGL